MAENPIKTPLPADLPEDWTGGQTVAPTGAEVGLSEQHGYNYLMDIGGFYEVEEAVPPASRKANTLYGLILADYTGTGGEG